MALVLQGKADVPAWQKHMGRNVNEAHRPLQELDGSSRPTWRLSNVWSRLFSFKNCRIILMRLQIHQEQVESVATHYVLLSEGLLLYHLD